MIQARFTILGVVVISAIQGCASHIVSSEHRVVRNELISLHEDQIMDNLIRIHFGKMYLHMYYTEATATGVWELTAEASQGGTEVKTDSDGDGLVLSNDSDNFGFGGSAKRSSSMALKGVPATDHPALYEAYEEFASKHLVYWDDDEIPVADSAPVKCCEDDFRLGGTRVLLSRTVKLSEFFPDASGGKHFAICACSKEHYLDLIQRTALAGPKSAKQTMPAAHPQSGVLFELLLKLEHHEEAYER